MYMYKRLFVAEHIQARACCVLMCLHRGYHIVPLGTSLRMVVVCCVRGLVAEPATHTCKRGWRVTRAPIDDDADTQHNNNSSNTNNTAAADSISFITELSTSTASTPQCATKPPFPPLLQTLLSPSIYCHRLGIRTVRARACGMVCLCVCVCVCGEVLIGISVVGTRFCVTLLRCCCCCASECDREGTSTYRNPIN